MLKNTLTINTLLGLSLFSVVLSSNYAQADQNFKQYELNSDFVINYGISLNLYNNYTIYNLKNQLNIVQQPNYFKLTSDNLHLTSNSDPEFKFDDADDVDSDKVFSDDYSEKDLNDLNHNSDSKANSTNSAPTNSDLPNNSSASQSNNTPNTNTPNAPTTNNSANNKADTNSNNAQSSSNQPDLKANSETDHYNKIAEIKQSEQTNNNNSTPNNSAENANPNQQDKTNQASTNSQSAHNNDQQNNLGTNQNQAIDNNQTAVDKTSPNSNKATDNPNNSNTSHNTDYTTKTYQYYNDYHNTYDDTYYNLVFNTNLVYSHEPFGVSLNLGYPLTNYKDQNYPSYQKTLNLGLEYTKLGTVYFGYNSIDDMQKLNGLVVKLVSREIGSNKSQFSLIYGKNVYGLNVNSDIDTNYYQFNTKLNLSTNLVFKSYFGTLSANKPLGYNHLGRNIEFDKSLTSFLVGTRVTYSNSDFELDFATFNYFLNNFIDQITPTQLTPSVLFNNLTNKISNKTIYNSQNHSFNYVKLSYKFDNILVSSKFSFNYLTEDLNINHKHHQKSEYGVNLGAKYYLLEAFTGLPTYIDLWSESYLFANYKFIFDKDSITTKSDVNTSQTSYTHQQEFEVGMVLKL